MNKRIVLSLHILRLIKSRPLWIKLFCSFDIFNVTPILTPLCTLELTNMCRLPTFELITRTVMIISVAILILSVDDLPPRSNLDTRLKLDLYPNRNVPYFLLVISVVHSNQASRAPFAFSPKSMWLILLKFLEITYLLKLLATLDVWKP